MDGRVKDAGASEGRSVIGRIGVRALPRPERVPTSGRSWITTKVRKGSTGEDTWTMSALGLVEDPLDAAVRVSRLSEGISWDSDQIV